MLTLEVHERSPLLWLDEACLDHRNIDESLTALPVYLAGSRQLLVLHGPSLTSRLWCIIEIYVFLKMEASTDRLCILPISSLQQEQSNEVINQFDVRQGCCASSMCATTYLRG